jgi:hypothetical protein
MRGFLNRFLLMICITQISFAYGQKLTLKSMIDATTCRDEACFVNAIKGNDICYKRTRTDNTGVYYRHQNCGADSTSDKRLIVHFAMLTDGNYNFSFLTWSEKYANSLKDELKIYSFEKIDNPENTDGNREWYHSVNYPHLNIMWESLTDNADIKRWHVGLVWE